MLRRSTFALCCAVLLAGHALAQNGAPTNFVDRPAVFRVTSDIVNEGVEPFTFTGGAFGNTLKREGRGSFEPGVFRTRLTARADSPDRIVDDHPAGIHYYDSYASGYLDGADVRVYRVVNGDMKLVREDRVAPGGTVIEYWNRNDGKIIPVGSNSARFKWASWSRPGAHRWFTVFAVDTAGNVSKPAAPVKLERSVAAANAKAGNSERPFRAKGGGDRTAPPAPRNFRAVVNSEGVVEMSWDAVQADDLAGYRVARTDTDPASHRGVYLQLAGGPASSEPIKAGDMVIVSKSLVDFRRAWLSHRLGNLNRILRDFIPTGVPNEFYPDAEPGKTWRLVRHEADSPVPNAGEYYLEMTLRAGDTELVGKHGIPDISTTSQAFYPVPEDGAEYVMEVWLRADRADAPPVVFTWDGDERVGGFIGAHELQPTTTWKRHEVRFTGRSTADGHHAYLVLKTTGPGTYSFDNFRVYRADTPYLDYLPAQYERLKNSGMITFRTHGPIKTGVTTYSMRQFLGEAGEAEGVDMGNTLPQMLRMMQKANVYPWLQIEYHMSPEEWLAFAEYMAAPYDPAFDTPLSKPYAHLRVEQGRQAPWVEAFDRIYFELANETWNGLFRPWTFDGLTDGATGERLDRGEVYGKFHDHVVATLQSSPYWTDELDAKFIHVLGGWSTSLRWGNGGKVVSRGYTQEAVRGSKTGEFITLAAYNGGWDEGEGPPQTTPASYFNVLSQVNQGAIPKALMLAQLAADSQAAGRPIGIGTYEAGPGYALNGLNRARVTNEQAAEQELVMKSKLAGTATLDSFLARAALGFDLQNFFTFDQGNLWKSHALEHAGGQPHASYLPLELFNRIATGDMLMVESVSMPTVDTGASRRRRAVTNAPLAAAYATRRGAQVHVFCVSRKIPDYPKGSGDGFTEMEIQLPFGHASAITLYRMTGKPTDTNIDAEKVAIESVTLDAGSLRSDGTFAIDETTGADARGLPPSETYLYVFEGVEMPRGRVLPLSEVVERKR